MRVLAGIALLCSMVPAMAGAQVLFNQDFSSSAKAKDYNATNYANTVTGDNRFNFVDAGQSAIVSTVGGNLQLSNTGDGDTAFGKTLSATPVPMLKVQVDVTLAFAGLTEGTPIGYFDFGSPAGGTSWGQMAFTVGNADSTWGILNNAGVGSGSFFGTQTVTMFLNDTGSTAYYIDPNGAEQNIADGVNDVWVGNTFAGSLQYSWIYTDSNRDITGFRWVSPNGWLVGAVTATFDNFRIEKIPTTNPL